MKKIGLDFKDRLIIHKLYINERAVIKRNTKAYKEAKIKKRVG